MISDKLTYQSDSWRCLSVLKPACNGLCRTAHSSDQRKMDGCPAEKINKTDAKQQAKTNLPPGFQIMTYVELGEVGEDLCEPVMVVLLGVLHLSHVKMSDAVDLVMLVNHCGRLPLSFG